MMKKIIIFIFLFIWQLGCVAQIPSNVNELKRYYQQNIQSLMPLEGIFSWSQKWTDSTFGTVTKSSGLKGFFYSKQYKKYIFLSIDNSGRITYRYDRGVNYIYNESSHVLSLDDGRYPNRIDDFDYFVMHERWSSGDSFEKVFVKEYPTPEMYAEAATPKEWSGTGFALKDGYLITNYHVIDGAGSISIQGVNGNFNVRYNAIVVASDRSNDIALLKISDGRFTGFGNVPYQLRSTLADVGESVYALGYPMADIMGDEIKFTDGKISSKSGIQGAVNVYQISVPIQPGNSGGPLFDQQGRIVGITTASLNKEMFNSENVNYAVKTGYIFNLIDSSVGKNILPTGGSMKNLSIPQQIKTAKKFVFFIKCKK